MAPIADSPLRSLSILYRKSHIWLSEGCAPCGLTAAQAVVILVVCDHGALTQDEITKRLSLDKSVVAKTVAKLEETGFLSRRTNPKDKRTYDIHPTEKAVAVYPALQSQIEAGFGRMTARMTKEERRQFQRLLALAADACLEPED